MLLLNHRIFREWFSDVSRNDGKTLEEFCGVFGYKSNWLIKSNAACEKALKQIEEKDYVAKLKQDGMKNFIKYGVACFKKVCKVVVEG